LWGYQSDYSKSDVMACGDIRAITVKVMSWLVGISERLQ